MEWINEGYYDSEALHKRVAKENTPRVLSRRVVGKDL